MNRASTSLSELEDRLYQLTQSAQQHPRSQTRSRVPLKTQQSSSDYAGYSSQWLQSFDDVLKTLRLEATLLNSEESPLMQQRRERQDARARRLAEARAIAEAQLEKLSRERELQVLREERRLQEERRREVLEAQAQKSALALQASGAKLVSSPPGQSEEDWEDSIAYTHELSKPPIMKERDSLSPSEITLSPDDSVFIDPDSLQPLPRPDHLSGAPQISEAGEDEVTQIKSSIPPPAQPQVITSPAPQPVEGQEIAIAVMINSLQGLLAPPRRINDERSFIGLERGSSRVLYEVPWEAQAEIIWEGVNYTHINKEIEGHERLSLAPQAFSPTSKLPRRTISLKLKETENPLAYSNDLLEDELDLSDFSEHRDPELFELDQTYRALEEQMEDLSFDEPQLAAVEVEAGVNEPRIDDLAPAQDDPHAGYQGQTSHLLNDHEDPFEVLDDFHFDQDRLMNDFNWTEGTPTDAFGEMTPTDAFNDDPPNTPSTPNSTMASDERRPMARIQGSDERREKGILSRFFRRK